jgi:hypothetical protein
MGHSEYDPVAKERRARNAGRKLGAKRALKPQQVWAIRFWLDQEAGYRIAACSISGSTPSYAGATSSRLRSATLSATARFAREPS